MAKNEIKWAAKWKDVPCPLELRGNKVCLPGVAGSSDLLGASRDSRLLKESFQGFGAWPGRVGVWVGWANNWTGLDEEGELWLRRGLD